MEEIFTKKKLDNGLIILLKEIHTAPIISQWVWYRVGSRNEIPGLTGISHWVEHMQFKGTERFPQGFMDKAIGRDGGFSNAFTYMDWTAYFETMPADKIMLPIEIEADRMKNSLFLPEEVEAERTVILSEREGSENEPMFLLEEALNKAAFSRHPYRVDVIGEKTDLTRMTRNDLFQHYQRYYAPDNAVLTLAGDFQTDEMLKRLKDIYGGIAPSGLIKAEIEPEGIIHSPVQVEISGPCDVPIFRACWRAPAGNDPDFFALILLDSILCGPSSLNMFGGGAISNKTSRLYQKLVVEGVAAAFNGSYSATIDPYLYTISAYVNHGHHPNEVKRIIDDELKRICDEGISQAELDKAVKQAYALFVYGAEDITNQGYWLGYSEMFSDASWFANYIAPLKAVSTEDARQCAQRFFTPEHCAMGTYLPDQRKAARR